jgi:hypothetical protein
MIVFAFGRIIAGPRELTGYALNEDKYVPQPRTAQDQYQFLTTNNERLLIANLSYLC